MNRTDRSILSPSSGCRYCSRGGGGESGLAGWLSDWLAGWFSDWLSDWLAGWLADSSAGWRIDWLTEGYPQHAHVCMYVCTCIRIPGHYRE